MGSAKTLERVQGVLFLRQVDQGGCRTYSYYNILLSEQPERVAPCLTEQAASPGPGGRMNWFSEVMYLNDPSMSFRSR